MFESFLQHRGWVITQLSLWSQLKRKADLETPEQVMSLRAAENWLTGATIKQVAHRVSAATTGLLLAP